MAEDTEGPEIEVAPPLILKPKHCNGDRNGRSRLTSPRFGDHQKI